MEELSGLRKLLDKALERAAKDCSTLLGHDLSVMEIAGRHVGRDPYFSAMEDASFLVGIETQGEYQGEFHLVLSLRDAIVLSGFLLGVPAARITEKKKLAILEADDLDAFSEIANQLIGSFNEVFKPNFPRKVHLKQLATRKFIPGNDPVNGGEPVAEGDYYLVHAQLGMPGQEMDGLDLLIPAPLAKLFDFQDDECGAQPLGDDAPAVTAESKEEVKEPLDAVLILEDNAADRCQFEEVLAASGVKPLVASFDVDLKILTEERVKAVLMGVVNADEWELSLCGRIKSHGTEISIPVIMCARQWTRTGVLKALQHGAREILLKPCPADELAAKVMKLVNAAEFTAMHAV